MIVTALVLMFGPRIYNNWVLNNVESTVFIPDQWQSLTISLNINKILYKMIDNNSDNGINQLHITIIVTLIKRAIALSNYMLCLSIVFQILKPNLQIG